MKAVYEMPKVSFEAFMANNAVSACDGINTNVIFDCVKDNGCQDIIANYFVQALGINFCENKTSYTAGFADYAGITNSQNDDIDDTLVDLDGWNDQHTNNNGSVLNWDTDKNTVNVSSKDGFLGWLYIGQSKKDGGVNYSKDIGWKIDDDELEFKKKNTVHAWLAPLFRMKGVSGG